MTLQEIRNAVLERVDEDPNDVEDMIKNIVNRAINDAYLEIARVTKSFIQKDNITLNDEFKFSLSQLTKPLDKILKITNSNENIELNYIINEDNTVQVARLDKQVKVFYTYIPNELVADTDVINLDVRYKEGLIYKGMVAYYSYLRKIDHATLFLNLYQQKLRDYKSYALSKMPRKFKINYNAL